MQQVQSLKTYFRLLSYLVKHWPAFLASIIGTAIASLTAAGFTWFLKPVLNKGFISPNLTFIHWMPFIAIAIAVATSSGGLIGDYFMAHVARGIVMDLQQNLFEKFLQLPAQFVDNHPAGKLIATLIYNVEQVTQACTTALMTLVRDGVYLIGLIVVMFLNSWLLALIFIATVPIIIFIFHFIAKHLHQISLRIQDAVADVSHIAEESVDGYKIVKSYGGKPYEIRKFIRAINQVRLKQILLILVNSLGTSTTRVISSTSVAIAIYIATTPAHAITAGAFISTISAMFAAAKPIRHLSDINSDIQKGIAGSESVFEVLNQKNEEDHGTIILSKCYGAIDYQNVSFTYPELTTPILSNLNLSINSGETIAIIGKSGVGKTTLVNLLLRYYPYQSGTIQVDHTDIQSIQLSSLRQQCAVAAENSTLFNDTIFNNLAYGCLNTITMDQMIAVSKIASVYDFIHELPNGFNTVVGKNGLFISSGQKQRIAIARALIKNAPILILDEATSNIDPETERSILEALKNQNRTTIIITHDLSTTKNIDKIFELREGQLHHWNGNMQ